MEAHIEITQQDAELDIKTYRARVEIAAHHPHFRLHRNTARMNIDSRMPTMHLDRSKLSPTISIGQVMQAASNYYRNALQSSSVGALPAANTAQLMLDDSRQAVVDLSPPLADMDYSGPDLSTLQSAGIRWDSGYLNINWTPGAFEMEWDTSTWADIRVEPHYVEIRMVKFPEIRIRVVYDQKKTRSNGKFVDKLL